MYRVQLYIVQNVSKKCPKCELIFISKEGIDKHSESIKKFKWEFKKNKDVKQHKLTAKSMGICTVCLKTGESTQVVNIP